MSRTIVINIDSKYRTNFYTSSGSDFIVNLNYPLTKVTSMKLANVQIPNSWHNISSIFKLNCYFLPIQGCVLRLSRGICSRLSILLIVRLSTRTVHHHWKLHDFCANVVDIFKG